MRGLINIERGYNYFLFPESLLEEGSFEIRGGACVRKCSQLCATLMNPRHLIVLIATAFRWNKA